MTCVYSNIFLFLFVSTSTLSVHTRADRAGRRMAVERPYLSWVWTNLEGKRRWSPVLSLGPTNGQRVLIRPLPAQAGLVLKDKTLSVFSTQSLGLLPPLSQKHLYNQTPCTQATTAFGFPLGRSEPSVFYPIVVAAQESAHPSLEGLGNHSPLSEAELMTCSQPQSDSDRLAWGQEVPAKS